MTICGVCFVFLADMHLKDNDRKKIASDIMQESRTHESRITSNGKDVVRESAMEMLNDMMPITALHGDGLRFVAMPSFSDTSYGVVIYLDHSTTKMAHGILTIFRTGIKKEISRRDFQIPIGKYQSVTSSFEKLTDGWSGENANMICLDGTSAAFEHIKMNRITSGVGTCEDGHYQQMKNIMLAMVRQFAPGNDLPNQEDWRHLDGNDQPHS